MGSNSTPSKGFVKSNLVLFGFWNEALDLAANQ